MDRRSFFGLALVAPLAGPAAAQEPRKLKLYLEPAKVIRGFQGGFTESGYVNTSDFRSAYAQVRKEMTTSLLGCNGSHAVCVRSDAESGLINPGWDGSIA